MNRPKGAPSPRRSRARRGEGDLLRKELIRAAEELLLEKGDADLVSVRDIAGRVGCSSPAIYLHFDSKDDLFFETCSRRWDEFSAEVMGSLSEGGPVADRLEAVARAYLRYGVEHPSQYRVLFAMRAFPSDEHVAEHDLPGAEGLNRLIAVLVEGMESGELAPGDPEATAIALWSAVHGAIMLLHRVEGTDPDLLVIPDLEVLSDALVDLCLEGLRARPA